MLLKIGALGKFSIVSVALTTILFSDVALGRGIQQWSYEQLTEAADLIVVAKSIATADTKEKVVPGELSEGLEVVGVETTFEVQGVFKGNPDHVFARPGVNRGFPPGVLNRKPARIVLRHYRLDQPIALNGPNFVAFDPQQPKTYLLFLKREENADRYLPVNGQMDPGLFSIIELKKPSE